MQSFKKDSTMSSNSLLRKVPIAPISPKTVRHRLTDVCFNARSPDQKPFIFKKNKTKRLWFG